MGKKLTFEQTCSLKISNGIGGWSIRDAYGYQMVFRSDEWDLLLIALTKLKDDNPI